MLLLRLDTILGPTSLYRILVIIGCGLAIAGDADGEKTSRLNRRVKRNVAPNLLSAVLAGHWIDEDFARAPFQYKIRGTDGDGDSLVYYKTPGAPEAQFGNWTLDRTTGIVNYWPFQDAYGMDYLYFTVTEQRTDSLPALSTNSTFAIEVRPVADPPVMFLHYNGNNLITDLRTPVKITMEENSGDNIAYIDLNMILGAYDVDPLDNHTAVVTTPPTQGSVMISTENTDILKYPSDCHLPAQNRTLQNDTNRSLPPNIPCNLVVPHSADAMSWITTVLTYKPNLGYYGNDSFQVIIYDKWGLPSQTPQNMLTVIVQILNNPCQNGATCYGRSNGDPTCSDTKRTLGFDQFDYGCACTRGWTGVHCQYDFNECFSTPCVPPYVCVDHFDGYSCECPTNNRYCQPQFPRWQMALITAAVGVFIATLTIFIIVLARRRQQSPTTASEEKDKSAVMTVPPGYPPGYPVYLPFPVQGGPDPYYNGRIPMVDEPDLSSRKSVYPYPFRAARNLNSFNFLRGSFLSKKKVRPVEMKGLYKKEWQDITYGDKSLAIMVTPDSPEAEPDGLPIPQA